MNFKGLNFDNQIIKPEYEGMLLRASMTDGILAGCGMTLSNDVLTIQRGALIAAGRVFALDGSQTITLTGSQRYARVLATVDTSRTASASEFLQAFTEVQTAASTSGFAALTTNDVNTSIGKYQMVLAVIDRTNQTILSTAPTSTSKLASKSVARSNLANNALYSPIIDATTGRAITADDLGWCVRAYSQGTSFTFTISLAEFQSWPTGFEFELVWYSGASVKLKGSTGIYLVSDEVGFTNGGVATLNSRFTIVAFKKVASDTLLVTGKATVTAPPANLASAPASTPMGNLGEIIGGSQDGISLDQPIDAPEVTI